MSNSERNFACLLVMAALLPFLSWVLSVLGVPCRSIFDDDGLRWLFRHAADCLHSRIVAFTLCCLMMQGVIRESLVPFGKTFRQSRFYRFAAVYAVVFICILIAIAAPDNSPLLSITGGLVGSPLLDGLPFLGWFSFIVFCLCYGHNSHKSWAKMLTYTIRNHPLAIPFAVVTSFCWQCIEYMLNL
ncbi:MAG: AbgT family transporter [Prevotellaceae bacterium]|nr:AbgT family transporter [Prevotellaceae bacterium]